MPIKTAFGTATPFDIRGSHECPTSDTGAIRGLSTDAFANRTPSQHPTPSFPRPCDTPLPISVLIVHRTTVQRSSSTQVEPTMTPFWTATNRRIIPEGPESVLDMDPRVQPSSIPVHSISPPPPTPPAGPSLPTPDPAETRRSSGFPSYRPPNPRGRLGDPALMKLPKQAGLRWERMTVAERSERIIERTERFETILDTMEASGMGIGDVMMHFFA